MGGGDGLATIYGWTIDTGDGRGALATN